VLTKGSSGPGNLYPAVQVELPWKMAGPMRMQVASASVAVYVPE